MNQVFHLYPLSFQNYINHRGKNNMYEKRSAANMLRAVGMHPKYKGYAYVLCILEKTGMEPERLYGSAGGKIRHKTGGHGALYTLCHTAHVGYGQRQAQRAVWRVRCMLHAHNNGVPRSDDGGPVLRAGRTQSLII